MKKSQRAKRNEDMAERLEAGQSVAQIVRETGIPERTARRFQAKWRQARSDAAVANLPAPPETNGHYQEPEVAPVEDSAPASPVVSPERLMGLAYAVGLSRGEIAAGLGIGESEIVVDDSTQQRFIANRVEALTRLRATKPDKWLDMMRAREEAEREEREANRIDRKDFVAFLSDLVGHQAMILSEADMAAWVAWSKELLEHRYPKLVV